MFFRVTITISKCIINLLVLVYIIIFFITLTGICVDIIAEEVRKIGMLLMGSYCHFEIITDMSNYNVSTELKLLIIILTKIQLQWIVVIIV